MHSTPTRRTLRAGKAGRRATQALPQTLAFMRLLWAVDHGLRSLSKHMQADIGLSGPQRLVLRMLGRLPPAMPSMLAELLHLDRSTVSGVLERLEQQRLLVRLSHPDDGRSVLVALSARGKLLDRDTPGTVEACIRRALATLPGSKIAAARQVLEAVASELTAEEERMARARARR